LARFPLLFAISFLIEPTNFLSFFTLYDEKEIPRRYEPNQLPVAFVYFCFANAPSSGPFVPDAVNFHETDTYVHSFVRFTNICLVEYGRSR
jgi:hypothetical protein